MSHEMLKTSVNPTIQEMLRNTIKLLCQNSIDFGLQLSIQGLIGITVDGSEVVLVNLQEHINKTKGPNAAGSSTSTAQKANTDGRKKSSSTQRNTTWSGPVGQSVKDEAYDDDCIELPGGKIAPKAEFHLKQEHGNGDGTNNFVEFDDNYEEEQEQEEEEDYAAYEENAEEEYDESEYYDNGNEDQYYDPTANDEGYEQQQQHLSGNFSQGVATKRKRTSNQMNAVKQRRPSSKLAVPKMEYDGGEDQKFFTGGIMNEAGGATSKMLPSEVEVRKVYTCSICGQSMRHASSFMRHKKQHDGTVYRCVCGKVVSRRDALTSHKKKCPAWAEQAQLHEQF